ILPPDVINDYNRQHRGIFNAINERDAQKEHALISEHLEKARDDLLKANRPEMRFERGRDDRALRRVSRRQRQGRRAMGTGTGAFPRSSSAFESETRRGSYLSPIIGFFSSN